MRKGLIFGIPPDDLVMRMVLAGEKCCATGDCVQYPEVQSERWAGDPDRRVFEGVPAAMRVVREPRGAGPSASGGVECARLRGVRGMLGCGWLGGAGG